MPSMMGGMGMPGMMHPSMMGMGMGSQMSSQMGAPQMETSFMAPPPGGFQARLPPLIKPSLRASSWRTVPARAASEC